MYSRSRFPLDPFRVLQDDRSGVLGQLPGNGSGLYLLDDVNDGELSCAPTRLLSSIATYSCVRVIFGRDSGGLEVEAFVVLRYGSGGARYVRDHKGERTRKKTLATLTTIGLILITVAAAFSEQK